MGTSLMSPGKVRVQINLITILKGKYWPHTTTKNLPFIQVQSQVVNTLMLIRVTQCNMLEMILIVSVLFKLSIKMH